jgi:hypothetical protein
MSSVTYPELKILMQVLNVVVKNVHVVIVKEKFMPSRDMSSYFYFLGEHSVSSFLKCIFNPCTYCYPLFCFREIKQYKKMISFN